MKVKENFFDRFYNNRLTLQEKATIISNEEPQQFSRLRDIHESSIPQKDRIIGKKFQNPRSI